MADSRGGTIIATAGIAAPPERIFQTLTTNEVERWWGHPDSYRPRTGRRTFRVCGQWSVTVRSADGSTNGGSGEFAQIDAPRRIAMTRKFEKHPLLGTRRTTSEVPLCTTRRPCLEKHVRWRAFQTSKDWK